MRARLVLTFGVVALVVAVAIAQENCPCADPAHCSPVSPPFDKPDYLGWFVSSDPNWMNYPWDSMTTYCAFGIPATPELLCYAHSKGVRVVLGISPNITILGDETATSAYIANISTQVAEGFMDGVNFDLEDPIAENSPQSRWYTELVGNMTSVLKSMDTNMQITVDVGWKSYCPDQRCYDYYGLAEACDYLIVMDYSMRSEVSTHCVASANAPLPQIIDGLNNFTKLGISPWKLAMGLPFYGFDYSCINTTSYSASYFTPNPCPISHIHWRDTDCSDYGTPGLGYLQALALLQNSSSPPGRLYDQTLQSPFFDYIDSTGVSHQVWYDDEESIAAKLAVVKQMGLRGIAVWEMNYMDYANDGSTQSTQSNELLSVLNTFMGNYTGPSA